MKILHVVALEFLANQNNGGKQASYRNFMMLRRIFGKENVKLFIFSNETPQNLNENIIVFPKFRNIIEQVIFTIAGTNQYRPSDERRIVETIESENADLIFYEFSILGRLLKKIRTPAVSILFMHNVERMYAWNKVKHDGIQYLPAFYSYARNERIAMRHVDRLITLTKRDSDLIESLYQRKADFIFPVSFDDAYPMTPLNRPDQISGKSLLFVGSLFRPNLQGIRWFVDNVMPSLPDVTLYIIGYRMQEKEEELKKENVVVIGTVENPAAWYLHCDAVVLPIFFGDGMKVKTAEALMYGKRIFAAEEALVGYDLDEIRDDGVTECNTSDEFISQIRSFFSSHHDGTARLDHVRNLFLSRYETRAIENKMEQFLLDCVSFREHGDI